LLQQYHIQGSPQFRAFSTLNGVLDFLTLLGEDAYVIKADGLMGGKGVKVAGEHLHSFQEAIVFCRELLTQGHTFLIEEKLIGQEFSLLNFCDGDHLIPMPLVQDHKRAFEGDQGPNTGGMGSYSVPNHSLPFLKPSDFYEAQAMNKAVLQALTHACGVKYQGILYGSFIATSTGVKLIEYNARFGDPEIMNVLAILDSDFLDICVSIVNGTLQPEKVRLNHWQRFVNTRFPWVIQINLKSMEQSISVKYVIQTIYILLQSMQSMMFYTPRVLGPWLYWGLHQH